MNSSTYDDPNDSFDDQSMTNVSIRLNKRPYYGGSRLSDGISEEYDQRHKKEFKQVKQKNNSPVKRKSQNLQFSAGLTYVLVHGKVQQTQQYIIDSMLPYANIDYRTRSNQITKQQKAVLIASSNSYP